MKPRTASLSIIFFLKHVHTPLLTPIHLLLWPRRQALSSPHHPHEIIQLELSGIYNASTVRALKAQIKGYRPDLIFLSETKTTINRMKLLETPSSLIRCLLWECLFLWHTGPRILGQIIVVWWIGLGSPQLKELFKNQVVHKACFLQYALTKTAKRKCKVIKKYTKKNNC